ncbi:DUF2626 domain-containing protein [Microaerobacter geothermalis]|uniref:DUF2626 domain-containing protein n=1 Tax=Microaerobacter geothermalis TaxID=674972 RepID=UPI001F18454E|nr:DUF2626 domain-containing protein [Microaerobacter geothermalis]MCF6093565.1 DUF2626 domain-containing protein [Microaerobacter geothermalis]
MGRMFRVLGFWTLIIGLMAMWGNLIPMALIFFGQTAVFVALSYVNLSEKAYLWIFAAYMVLSFTGFTFYSFFIMPQG